MRERGVSLKPRLTSLGSFCDFLIALKSVISVCDNSSTVKMLDASFPSCTSSGTAFIPVFPLRRNSSSVALMLAKLGSPCEVSLLFANDIFLSDVRESSVDDGNEVSWLSLRMREFSDLSDDRRDKHGDVRLLCEATSALSDLTSASSLGSSSRLQFIIVRTVPKKRDT